MPRAVDRDERELSAGERAIRDRLAAKCAGRARAMREVDEFTRDIAAECLEARERGIGPTTLARFVTIPDEDGGVRTVTRQAIDQMIRAFLGPVAVENGAASEDDLESSIDLSIFQ